MNEIFLLIKDKNKIAIHDKRDGVYLLPSICSKKIFNNSELKEVILKELGLNVVGIKLTTLKDENSIITADLLHNYQEYTNLLNWITVNKALQSNFINIKESKCIHDFLKRNYREDNVKLQYGLLNNRIKHISEIEPENRGEKCGCICPLCHQKLQARIGTGKRKPHFAHSQEGCDIDSAQQTALHLLAKEILAEHNYIRLPEYIVDVPDEAFVDYDSNHSIVLEQLEPLKVKPETKYIFDHVVLENRVDEIIPDVMIWSDGYNNRKLMVEIAVTHFIDEVKREKIINMNAACIEIDLSGYHNIQFDREVLKKEIIENVESKNWIYNTHYKRALEILNERNLKISEKYKAEYERIEKEKMSKEKRKNRKKEEKLKAIDSMLKKDNYIHNINQMRNDKEVLRRYKTKHIYNLSKNEIPFYLDIPLTGQVAFSCDRRIWQMEIFEKFIYYRPDDSVLSIIRIWNWLTEHTKGKYLNWDMISRKEFQLGKVKYSENLALDALKKYLIYLSDLGFVNINRGFVYYEDHEVISGVIEPPNIEFANTFEAILKGIEDTSLVDSDILETLAYWYET